MPRAVDAVEDEREAEDELEGGLDGKGQVAKGGGDAGALEVQAEDGGDEVRGHVAVERAGQGDARDAVPGGAAEPRLLELVDAEMGGHGALQALVDEDLVAGVDGELVHAGGSRRGRVRYNAIA